MTTEVILRTNFDRVFIGLKKSIIDIKKHYTKIKYYL